jgi:hypothetical protein
MGMAVGQPLATNKRTSTNINQNPKDLTTTTEHSTTVDNGKLNQHDIILINNNSNDNNSDDDDDDNQMRIDDMQPDSRLTHMKKIRQINKRPPSFRLKNKGEKIEDADTLLPLPTTTVVQPTAPSPDNVPNGSPVVKIPKTVTPVVSSQTEASNKQAKDEKVNKTCLPFAFIIQQYCYFLSLFAHRTSLMIWTRRSH